MMEKNISGKTLKLLPDLLEMVTDKDDPEGLIQKLRQREYMITDTKVSSRVFNFWKNNGVIDLPPEVRSKWVKLNFIDYVWLCLVKDMRVLGISIDSIKKIKKYVFAVITIVSKDILTEDQIKDAFIKNLMNNDKKPLSKTEAKLILETMQNELGEQKLMDFIQDSWGTKFNQLEIALYNKLLFNFNPYLIIVLDQEKSFGEQKSDDAMELKDKEDISGQQTDVIRNTFIWSEMYHTTNPESNLIESLNDAFHVRIPIEPYISDFVTTKANEKQSLKLGWITKEENDLLQHIRNDDAESIHITFKDNKMELIEVSKYLKPELELKLLKLFGNNQYGEIKYVFANGKKQSIRITNKFKVSPS